MIADECDLNEEVCMIQLTMGSVNYGDELNQGEGFDKATFFFLLTPKYQRSIVSQYSSFFLLNVLIQASRGLSLGCVLLKSSANTRRGALIGF